MKGDVYLSDGEWMVLEPLLPKVKRRKDKRGRPPKDSRDVLNSIIWILFSGSPWHQLPDTYPPYQTCHCYFQSWTRKGVMQKMLGALSTHHREEENKKKCLL